MIANLGEYAHPKKDRGDKPMSKKKWIKGEKKDEAVQAAKAEDAAGKRRKSPLHSHPRSP